MSTGSARERISLLLFYGTVLLLAYLLFLLFKPFLTPLAWAAILAALFYSPHKQMERLWGRTLAASASTAAVIIVVIVPAAIIMTAFVEEAAQAFGSVDISVQTRGFARLQTIWTTGLANTLGIELPNLEDLVKQATTWLATVIAGQAGVLLRNVVVIVVDVVVMLFAVFFFFRDGDVIMAAVRRVLPFEPEQSERMIAEAHELIHASVVAGLIVAVVQGALGGITFAALGIGAAVFWGVIMAFFALLPIAGAWIVWAPAAVWLMLTGRVGRGIVLIAIGAGVIGLVDNFLRPALLSGRTQLNGLLVFVSLLGGISAFGFLGLILGPVIMATAIGVIDVYTKDRRATPRNESPLIERG
jgi:predicted PurR-regulated permease PerM